MKEAANPEIADDYRVTVCRNCDPLRPGDLGRPVEDICPECGARMFGMVGTEATSTKV